jgi:hypothetical protein
MEAHAALQGAIECAHRMTSRPTVRCSYPHPGVALRRQLILLVSGPDGVAPRRAARSRSSLIAEAGIVRFAATRMLEGQPRI